MIELPDTQYKNEAWKIENTGIDIVPEHERTATPLELFWIWSAANIGILGIVYGAIIVSFRLSFFQSLLATIVGIASFALVGYISLAGQKGRTTTLTLSRTIFGKTGNIAPTFFSWITLMGWEAINMITGTLTLKALFHVIGLSDSIALTIVCMVLFGGLAITISLLGQATVVVIQSWITRIFGTMTLIAALYIIGQTDWNAVLSMPSGDWLTGFLPAVSIIAAGTGIGWGIAGADYSRYQSDRSSKSGIFNAVTFGAMLPLFILLFTGILLSARLPELASSENPIALIGTALPSWMSIPYLLTATAGIITIAVLSLYSASLNLLTIGIKIRQVYAVVLDAILVMGVAIYILFIAGEFMDSFIAFLLFCGVFLASWEAVFMLDYAVLRRRKGYEFEQLFGKSNVGIRWVPLLCWLLGALAGLLVSDNQFIKGPWATGIFQGSSLSILLSFVLSFVLYSVYLMFSRPVEKH
ncbi:purine-cytosine permease-like protein [Providencia alcalifaciens]|nr:purine-cytosine permease-like protein [Providencia alcalifaciens]